MKTICGWGRFPVVDADVITPASIREVLQYRGAPGWIARGAGRSYGDSASETQVVDSALLDHFIAFDDSAGVIECEAGVLLRDILKVVVPRGWFLPVVPGTGYVTLAGAIASDVHGKNHHSHGAFSSHVLSMQMRLADGSVVTVTEDSMPELFHATCGGMGLTGMILDARVSLRRISSPWVSERVVKTRNLDETLACFDTQVTSTYCVAWTDCIAAGEKLGRSVVYFGEHAAAGDVTNRAAPREPWALPVPVNLPGFAINRYSIGIFNRLKYAVAPSGSRLSAFWPYFFPLDALRDWNRLYGRKGFLQYQFVIPKTGGAAVLRRIMARISSTGLASALAVLKLFGPGNSNLLSFPMEGYTLALDFPRRPATFKLLEELDRIVMDAGGRLYLAKDARMSATMFRQTYPRWEEFEAVRERYGAIGHFSSMQSKRLGLK
jgi:FAD/FMN-containing dehydrogenase